MPYFYKYYLLIMRKPCILDIICLFPIVNNLRLNTNVSVAHDHMASKWQSWLPDMTALNDQLCQLSHTDIACPQI